MPHLYKLILIDDQKIINFVHRKIISLIDPGLEIIDFVDPYLALEAIKETPPDLIFLDLNMPQMNGWQLLDKMNENEIKIPVIILTSSGSHSDRKRAENYSQVICYEQKPLHKVGFEKLLNRLAIK